MAWVDDVLEGETLLTTAVIGVGAAVLLPVLRPALKTAVKGGVIAYDWARRVAEDARQSVQESAEEARSGAREARTNVRSKGGSPAHEAGSTSS